MSSEVVDQNAPQGVIHYRILIDSTKSNDLVFTREMVKSDSNPDLVFKWAEDAAKNHFAEPLVRSGESPYDLPARKPCWIVLELDGSKRGWQFDEKKKGIITKDINNKKIKDLKHVYYPPVGSGGLQGAFDDPQGDGCYVVYFRVEYRAEGEKCEVDIVTEFLQGGKRLKIIFDPDVPTSGDDPP